MSRLPLLLSLLLALILALAGGAWLLHRMGLAGGATTTIASAPLAPDAPLVVTELTHRNPGILQLDGKVAAGNIVTLTQNGDTLADTTAGADGHFSLSARLPAQKTDKTGWQALQLATGETTAILLLNGDRALLKLGTDWQPLRRPRTGFGLLTLTRATEPRWSLSGQLGDLPATAHSLVYIYGDETLVATTTATGPLFAATLPLLPHATIRIDAFDAATARPLGRASVHLPLEGQLERVTAAGDPVWIWRDLADQAQDLTVRHVGQLTPIAPAPAPLPAQ